MGMPVSQRNQWTAEQAIAWPAAEDSRPEQLVDEIVWQPKRDIPALRIDLDAYFRSVHDERVG